MPLAIARVAVGKVGGLAENADGSRFFIPAHDAIIRNVAPEEIAAVAEPHRSFGPAEATGDFFHLRAREAIFREARVDDLDERIGIAGARLPLREDVRQDGHGGERTAGGEKVAAIHGRHYLTLLAPLTFVAIE